MVIDQPVSITFYHGTPIIVTGMSQKWYADIVKKMEDSISRIDLGQIININTISSDVVRQTCNIIPNLIKSEDKKIQELIDGICEENNVTSIEVKNNPSKYLKVVFEIIASISLAVIVDVLINLGKILL